MPDDYGRLYPKYGTKSFYYYMKSNSLVEEQEDIEAPEEIFEPELFVGNVLEESGFFYRSDNAIYIRNEKMGKDIEVIKVNAKFEG